MSISTFLATKTLDGLIDDILTTSDKSDAHLLLVGGSRFELCDFPNLRGIFKTGVGTDNLPFEAAASRGIEIRLPSQESREVIFEETANFACHLILKSLYRRAGNLADWTKLPRVAMSSNRLLVLGLGNIGSRVYRKMQEFCLVDSFDVATNQPHELRTLIEKADCVSLHIPLSPETEGFINAEKLSWLRDGACIVNTSRGAVVSEEALFDELSANRLFASFDVFWQEPYEGRLREFHPDPFYMTPHVASTCDEFLRHTAVDFRGFVKRNGTVQMNLAMIPARMGSQRLKRKNLRELAGIPLITRAIRKCMASDCFDEIWINSEDTAFAAIADNEGVQFHKRPEPLGDNNATSEQYVAEFLREHECDVLFQVHSIAPLLTVSDIKDFVAAMDSSICDCLLSTESIQIECALDQQPINFTFAQKTNSQELTPVQRVSWSITAWRRSTYLRATEAGECATYAGVVRFHAISRLAAHVIKTEEDLRIAEALLPLVDDGLGAASA